MSELTTRERLAMFEADAEFMKWVKTKPIVLDQGDDTFYLYATGGGWFWCLWENNPDARMKHVPPVIALALILLHIHDALDAAGVERVNPFSGEGWAIRCLGHYSEIDHLVDGEWKRVGERNIPNPTRFKTPDEIELAAYLAIKKEAGS